MDFVCMCVCVCREAKTVEELAEGMEGACRELSSGGRGGEEGKKGLQEEYRV